MWICADLSTLNYVSVCEWMSGRCCLDDFVLCMPFFRTLDDGVYKIALSLAKRYSVPLWEVYMTHLEFLFTDSGYVHTHTH